MNSMYRWDCVDAASSLKLKLSQSLGKLFSTGVDANVESVGMELLLEAVCDTFKESKLNAEDHHSNILGVLYFESETTPSCYVAASAYDKSVLKRGGVASGDDLVWTVGHPPGVWRVYDEEVNTIVFSEPPEAPCLKKHTKKTWIADGLSGRRWSRPYPDSISGEYIESYVVPLEHPLDQTILGVIIVGSFLASNQPYNLTNWTHASSYRSTHKNTLSNFTANNITSRSYDQSAQLNKTAKNHTSRSYDQSAQLNKTAKNHTSRSYDQSPPLYTINHESRSNDQAVEGMYTEVDQMFESVIDRPKPRVRSKPRVFASTVPTSTPSKAVVSSSVNDARVDKTNSPDNDDSHQQSSTMSSPPTPVLDTESPVENPTSKPLRPSRRDQMPSHTRAKRSPSPVDPQTAALAAKSAGLLRKARQERERLNTLRRLIHEDNSKKQLSSTMSSMSSTQSARERREALSPPISPDDSSWLGEPISSEKKLQEPRPNTTKRIGNMPSFNQSSLDNEADDSLFGATVALEKCRPSRSSEKRSNTSATKGGSVSINLSTQFKPSAFEASWIHSNSQIEQNILSSENISRNKDQVKGGYESNRNNITPTSKEEDTDSLSEDSQNSIDTDFYSLGPEEEVEAGEEKSEEDVMVRKSSDQSSSTSSLEEGWGDRQDHQQEMACSPPRLSPNMHPGVRIRRIITRFF